MDMNVNGTASWLQFSLSTAEKHNLAKWTMMMWCVTIFCFLNATAMSTFFAAYVSRNPKHEIEQVHDALGMAIHWPQIYFRAGYVLMVVSLSSFFYLVMEFIEMSGCLAFCVTFLITPMFYSMARAFSVFTLENEEKLSPEELHEKSTATKPRQAPTKVQPAASG